MVQALNGTWRQGRVNILKKVRIDGVWRLCPAVIEAGGKLKDRVRVRDRVELHAEGTYYLDWRENGRRLREAIPERADVRERARLKALEIEARRAGIAMLDPQDRSEVKPAQEAATLSAGAQALPVSNAFHALGNIFGPAFEQTVRSELQRVGLDLAARAPQTFPEWNTNGSGSIPRQSGREGGPAGTPPGASAREDVDTIAKAIETYLKDVEPPQREPKTYEEYKLVLHHFRLSCKKTRIKDIARDDLKAFMRYLYAQGNEARTVYNRIGIVLQLLNRNGIKGLLLKGDKPKYVENVREMYEPGDLEALFKVCEPDEKMRYLFFLLTGERDKEVRHTAWSDIDFPRQCVRVTAKKQLGFKPKDKEEREIPVPASLLAVLKEYKSRQSGPNAHNLVFPTGRGRPDRKFERSLKRIAWRNRLNCWHCISKHGNKCAEGPHCSKWYLHKFRHTYATTSLENGVSIRTLQEWLGHSDIESTMVYLKYVRRKDIQELLDKSAMAGFAAQPAELAKAANLSPAS
jgi:integrase/recombinase XerD